MRLIYNHQSELKSIDVGKSWICFISRAGTVFVKDSVHPLAPSFKFNQKIQSNKIKFLYLLSSGFLR